MQLSENEEFAKAFQEAKLQYVSDTIAGISREHLGEDFAYFDYVGQPITDKVTLDRISSLRIPPAWENVWICPYNFGHLQATGIDEKGRKQYLYHPEWTRLCQEHKFAKMEMFGELLPRIRSKIRADLNEEGLIRRKVLAAVVWLLQHTFIRVGNEEYRKENESFGLTTLRMKHTTIKKDAVTFDFTGKSNVQHLVSVKNPKVVKIIKQCSELPGYELFQYLDAHGNKYAIGSSSVNEYLHEITDEAITAKDFRTWGGSVLALSTLDKLGRYETENQAKKNIATAVKNVANHLRNTPKVCRSYYIHPVVITSYQENQLNPFIESIREEAEKRRALAFEEYALLRLLKQSSGQAN